MEPPMDRGRRSRPRFLVVEDEADFGHVLSRAISRFGETTLARSLPEAREMLARHPDGLVVDVHLGDGDGLTLLRELQARGRWLPALVITADEDPRITNQVHLLDARIAHKPDLLRNLDHFCARVATTMARLLVVADDPKVARTYVSRVRPYIDAVIGSGLAAAEQVRSEPWAGIVIDERLRGVSAMDLALRARAEHPDREILLYLHDTSARVVEDAERHGVQCALIQSGHALLERFARNCARLAHVEPRTEVRLDVLAQTAELDPRERDVLVHALRSTKREHIARAMSVAERTVRNYVTSILAKTGFSSLTSLVQHLTR